MNSTLRKQVSDFVRHFKCWLCYGHFYYEVGYPGKDTIIVQCYHCTRTEIVNRVTGEVS